MNPEDRDDYKKAPISLLLGRKDEQGEMFIARKVFGAMGRAGPPKWEDPNILPADPTTGNTLMGLV